jgi:hypothetical protein
MKSARLSERPPDVREVHIVWITAGLGCDGDTVSITAAEQPSIEDLLLGAIPGLPKVHLHNPVLAPQVGDEFMDFFYQAERGALDPFVLVVEGSIPNEQIKTEGYWAAQGTDPITGQPITDAVQGTPIFEENPPEKFKGIDIMRAVRSFDPCLPCGVHMYLGNGRILETRHSPMFGAMK